MSKPSKILQKESKAYQAYIASGQLSANAPHPNTNIAGQPLLYTGEIYCRMPHQERRICGKACAGTTPLKKHILAIHQQTAVDAINEGRKGNIAGDDLQKLRDFYNGIMEFEPADASTPQSIYQARTEKPVQDPSESVVEDELERPANQSRDTSSEEKESETTTQTVDSDGRMRFSLPSNSRQAGTITIHISIS